jgi:hypothetical protein
MVQMMVGIIWCIEYAKGEWLSPTQYITGKNGGSNYEFSWLATPNMEPFLV